MTAMPTPRRFDAVLFDLDGVLTATAALHAACWKERFDPLLAGWSRRTGRPQEPFDIVRDYRAHVGDGDRAAFRAAGADVVVGDLAELLP